MSKDRYYHSTFAADKQNDFNWNMKAYNFLAFDLGATSGRAVLGTLDGDRFEMREIHRFPNSILELRGRFYWDIYRLYDCLLEGLRKCAQEGVELQSIGIDTWGVDFGFVASDGSLIGLPRSYRDPYTTGAPEEFFKGIPSGELYDRTGIQVMAFNSLFQLYRMNQGSFVPQAMAERILFMPDLLAYMLTDNGVCEYTVASTSHLLDARKRDFDPVLLEAVGVSPQLFGKVVDPGTAVGCLSETVSRKTGIGRVPVVTVAGHDTASAVAAVPAATPNFAYLSSGTWSLMGIEVDQPIINEASVANNFTNEGGVEGTIRFLKNITGMWLLERCKEAWKQAGRTYSYDEFVRMAKGSAFDSLINPDDPRFANPVDMPVEIAASCEESGQAVPQEDADYVRCIFRSLANRYKNQLELLASMSPFPIECLHVIGGGSRNDLLNQWTADAIGLPVLAGPSEATAIGNCLLQAKAAGLLKDRWEMRKLIAANFPMKTFLPEK